MIYVYKILKSTSADGPGLRTSVYCSLCKHYCPGCHGKQTWSLEAGKSMETNEIMKEILDDEFSNVSFSGGDPFYQVEGFLELAKEIKTKTNKTIWCWTGFTLEELQNDPKSKELLEYIDVLIDGPFILEKRDLTLKYRGSSNQKIWKNKNGNYIEDISLY